MKLILLGTGSPIVDSERQGPSTLLEINGEYFLFDTGRGVTTQINKAGINLNDIGLIFITHHHVDHISDLGDLLLAIWKSGRIQKIQIYGPKGTSKIILSLLNDVFGRDIEFTIAMEKNFGNQISDIRELVEIIEIKDKLVFNNSHVKITAEQVEHGQLYLGLSHENWPSLGYRIEMFEKIIVISGDTIICDGLRQLTKNANILVQCCFLTRKELDSEERKLLSRHIIASSIDLGQFATQQKIDTLILTHLRKKTFEMTENMKSEVKNQFDGNLIMGHDLFTLDI